MTSLGLVWIPFLFLAAGGGTPSRAAPTASPIPVKSGDDFRAAGGAADLLGAKEPPPATTPQRNADRFSPRCTDDEGMILSDGDAGYGACIAKAQKKPDKKHNSYE